MGVVVENARGAAVENNELEGITAYGVMVRGSSNTLVQATACTTAVTAWRSLR